MTKTRSNQPIRRHEREPGIGHTKVMYCTDCGRKQTFVYSEWHNTLRSGKRRGWKCTVNRSHEIVVKEIG